jgi:hypothetical protein
MPDFAGAALGFLLQVEDQASATLQRAEDRYRSLSRAMDLTSATARRSSSKSADSMALMAGSVDAVSKSSEQATTGVDALVAALKKADKLHPINVTADFDGKKSGRGGGAAKNRVTLRAQYPSSGWRDPHFNRSSLLSAYKEIPVAPNYVMDLPAFAQGGQVSGGIPGKDSVAAMLTPGEVVLPVWLVNAFKQIMGQAGGRVDVVQTFAEGGVAGAAGASGAIPDADDVLAKFRGTKDFTKVIQQLSKVNISGLMEIDPTRAEGFANALKQLSDETVSYADKAKIAVMVTSEMRKSLGTVRIAASQQRVPLVKLQSTLGLMPTTLSDMRKEVRAATGAFAGMEEGAIGVAETLNQYKAAIYAAVESSASLPVALGTAAFATAYMMDKAFFEVRQNIAMTDAQFQEFTTAGSDAMGQFGLSIEEMTNILKKAAWMKLSGNEAKEFIQTTAMATQALDGMGVTAEEVTNLMWNGFAKVGLNAKQSKVAIAGMVAAAQRGNTTFNDLSKAVQENNELFLLIQRRSGGAGKAITDMSATMAALGNAFIDPKATMDFVNNLTDRRKWGEMGSQLGLISRATGLTAQDLATMADNGDIAGVAAARMAAAFEVDESLMSDPQKLMELYGMTREEVMLAQQEGKKLAETQYKGLTPQQAFIKNMEKMNAETKKEAEEGKALQESFDNFNNTLANVWNRIAKKFIPMLWELGEPIVMLANIALKPVIWAMDALLAVFKMIPGPIKMLAGMFLGATLAVAAYNAAVASGALLTIRDTAAKVLNTGAVAAGTVVRGLGAAALWVYNAAMGAGVIATIASTVAAWNLNAALYANPIGLVVIAIAGLVAGLGLLVYGFMEGATWAKWLGFAILMAMGPFGMFISAAALMYDTLFGGGDMLESLFDTLAGGMDWLAGAVEGAVDWVVSAIEALPDKVVNFIGGIPDMIAGLFSESSNQSRIGEAFSNMFYAGLRLVYALFVKIPAAIGGLMLKGLAAYGNVLIDVLTWPFKQVIGFVSSLFTNGITATLQNAAASIVSILTFVPRMVIGAFDYYFGTNLKKTFTDLISWLVGIGSSVMSALTTPYTMAYEGIKSILGGLWEWVSNLFSSAMNIGGTIYESVMSGVKGMVNSYIIDPINAAFNFLNEAIDYIPGYDKGTLGVARLAEGGIVNSPTRAIVGEAGPEAVIPLTDMRAVGEFANAAGGGAAPQVTVNMNQDKVEALLAEIRDFLGTIANAGNPRTSGASTGGGGGGGMMKRASNWEF